MNQYPENVSDSSWCLKFLAKYSESEYIVWCSHLLNAVKNVSLLRFGVKFKCSKAFINMLSVLSCWNMKQALYNVIKNTDGPKRCPNNLPQPEWRLAELFFQSDLSWSQADLCTNSYVNSTHFSLLAMKPLCTRYISYVGIRTGLNSFQNFPYVTTFLLRSISVFYLWKIEWFRKELSPVETVIFRPRNFGKRSFSEILEQCNFGKNGVWRIFLDSLLSHLLSKNTWTSAILERMESYKFFWKAYYLIYLVQTPSWRIWNRTISETIDSKFNSYVRNS